MLGSKKKKDILKAENSQLFRKEVIEQRCFCNKPANVFIFYSLLDDVSGDETNIPSRDLQLKNKMNPKGLRSSVSKIHLYLHSGPLLD